MRNSRKILAVLAATAVIAVVLSLPGVLRFGMRESPPQQIARRLQTGSWCGSLMMIPDPGSGPHSTESFGLEDEDVRVIADWINRSAYPHYAKGEFPPSKVFLSSMIIMNAADERVYLDFCLTTDRQFRIRLLDVHGNKIDDLSLLGPDTFFELLKRLPAMKGRFR